MTDLRNKIDNIINYVKPYVQILNKKCEQPASITINKIPLKESIPDILKMPIIFISLCALIMLFLFTYANFIIFYGIGIIYPIIRSINFEDNDQIIIINKYWILFSIMILFDYPLMIIPLYNFVRIILIYLLVQNDFVVANLCYDKIIMIKEMCIAKNK